MNFRDRIAEEVVKERKRQVGKFGRQELDRTRFIHILTEEVGEISNGILNEHPISEVRKELIQVAAVAVQWVEEIDFYTAGHTEDVPYPNFLLERRKS